MSFGPAAACAAIRRAVRALSPPVARLEDAERQRLGGLIFYGAAHFVNRVSQILNERPALSPDPARIHAAGLAGRQRRAACWAMVHGALSDLAELANDCFLHEQGLAVEEAQQVLARFDLALAQGLLQGSPQDLPQELIDDALQIARPRVLLSRVQKRQRQARKRGERQLKEAQQKSAGRSATSPAAKATGRRRRQPAAQAPTVDLLAWGRRPATP